MRARRCRAWLLGLVTAAVALCARPLSAQVAETSGLQLVYQAPAECPDRAHFERQLRARLPQRATAATGALEVRIARAARSVRAALVLVRPDGARAVRELDAPSCDQAVEALALVAALMFDAPHAATASAPAGATLPAAAAGGRNAARSEASQGPGGRTGAAASGAGGGSEGHAAAERPEADREAADRDTSDREAANREAADREAADREAADREAAAASAAAVSAPAASAALASTEPPASRAPPVRREVALAAAALLATGVAPGPRVGALFALNLTSQRGPRLELLGRLGLRFTQGYESEREQGDVSMTWWAGSSTFCAGWRAAHGAIDGCLAAELGQLLAQGRNTADAASPARVWAALGPAVQGRVMLVGPLSLEAGLLALFPFAHHRYTLAGETVHSVPPLTIRAELGLCVQIH